MVTGNPQPTGSLALTVMRQVFTSQSRISIEYRNTLNKNLKNTRSFERRTVEKNFVPPNGHYIIYPRNTP